MKLIWRARARRDLSSLIEYISGDSIVGARRVNEQILHSVDFLRDWPDMGRQSRRPDVRELVIPHTPYLVLYRRTGKTVFILRVLHGSRRR